MTAGRPFNDHFSDRAAEYARFRPVYPKALFEHLAGIAPGRRLAWDCATGNGQAAVALAADFDEVFASDASETQIAAAIAAPRVRYRVAPAEHSGLASGSVDLVTVAQALHWFDLPRFFEEVSRVVRERGVLAAWCYQLCSVNAEIDSIVATLYTDIVGEYWPAERSLIESGYRGIVFPGEAVDVPEFPMQAEWLACDMLGYLRTWSASKRYERAQGRDPVSLVEQRLTAAWGDSARTVRWPLGLVVRRFRRAGGGG